jgi:3-phenylpropionate/trans-cinnamate dioxygenase ferredoxin reductase subunit
LASANTFLIVGGGLAGARAAATLREEGFDGRCVLLADEAERPYERPPLSKEYLRDEAPRDKAYVHDESFYAEHAIELRTSTQAVGLDARQRTLVLLDGEQIGYDRLLLATGAEPRRLPVPGHELEGVEYLRTLADCDALRARFAAGGRAVVIGGGWIGAEVAASARQKGLDVTIVEAAELPLLRVLGREVATVYADLHRDHGVELITSAQVEAIEGGVRAERVRLAGGRTLDCDFVVVGIGVAPRTQLAEAAGLHVDNGIVVTETLHTSVPGVFAAGDVANAEHPLYGRVRVEHWANALNQGPVAARNMLGMNEPYERVPYFYSDQYDTGMEYSGYASADAQVVFRGDPASREFIAFWIDDGRVAAAMNVNVWDVTDPLQALIRSRRTVTEAELADPDVPLADLTPA